LISSILARIHPKKTFRHGVIFWPEFSPFEKGRKNSLKERDAERCRLNRKVTDIKQK
jgi:hypothetical protein